MTVHRLRSIIWKEFIQMRRDRATLAMMLGIPVIQLMVFGFAIRMDVQKDKFPELLKLEKQCKLMMRTASWIADYPDADNFMQLLYSKNIYQSNNACANMPEYDKLYEQSIRMPAGPERDRLYHEMTKVIEAYTPWRLNIARYRNMLTQPHVLGFRKHPILHAEWKYIDVAPKGISGAPRDQ